MTYAIVDANCTYYKDGKFPSDKIPTTPPAPVVSETVKIKYEQNPPFQPSPF